MWMSACDRRRSVSDHGQNWRNICNRVFRNYRQEFSKIPNHLQDRFSGCALFLCTLSAEVKCQYQHTKMLVLEEQILKSRDRCRGKNPVERSKNGKSPHHRQSANSWLSVPTAIVYQTAPPSVLKKLLARSKPVRRRRSHSRILIGLSELKKSFFMAPLWCESSKRLALSVPHSHSIEFFIFSHWFWH